MKGGNKRILEVKRLKINRIAQRKKKEVPPKKMSPFTNMNYKIIFPSYIR